MTAYNKNIVYTFVSVLFLLLTYSCGNNEVDRHDLRATEDVEAMDFIRWFGEHNEEAQQRALDSLEQIHQGDSTHNSFLLSQFLRGYVEMQMSNFQGALDFLQPLIEKENVIQEYPNFHLMVLTKTLNCYNLLEIKGEGLKWIEEGNRIVENVSDIQLQLEFKLAMASIYSSVNQYSEALSLLYEVIDYVENNNLRPSLMITAYNDLALVLIDLKKFDDAKTNIEKALFVFEESGYSNERTLARTYNNAAIAYKGLGETDEAIEAIHKSIEINNKYFSHDLTRIVKNYYNLGTFYLELDSTDRNALNNFKKGLLESEKIDFSSGIAYNSYGIGEFYLAQDDMLKAETYLLVAEPIFRSQENTQMLYNVLRALIKVAKYKGEYERALRYFSEFFKLEQVYHEYVLNRDTEELSIKHKVEQTSLENQLLQNELSLKEKENERNYLVVLFLSALSVSGFILIMILFYSRRKIRAAHHIVKEKNQEIKSKNNDLNELIRQRDALVKTIIHDLRNPLSSIQGFTHLLQEENSQEERTLFLEMLNSASNHMDILISSLLNAYKETEQIASNEMQEVNVNQLLLQIIKGFDFDARHKQITIHTNIEEVVVRSDRSSLYSIFGNLLSNAIKFSPKGTNIFISLSKKENHWEFVIKDEGPGFSDEDQEKMFSMFKKLSAHPTNNENSTGIGLYSVKKTMLRLGGEIKLNNNYNNGAELICVFPF